MSQFNYTDEEKNINRVLKMNRDSSNQLLSGLQSSTQRNEADSNINDSVALLRSLGYSKDVDKIFLKRSLLNIFINLKPSNGMKLYRKLLNIVLRQLS